MKIFLQICALGLGVGMAVAGDVDAKGRLVKCNFEGQGSSQATPTELLLDYSEGRKKMYIYDNFLKHFKHDQVLADISQDNAKRFTARWRARNIKSGGQSLDVRFKLAWNRSDGSATIRAEPVGWDNDFVGTGSCKFTK